MRYHGQIRQQSTPLTQGKTLRHGKLVHAFDLTMAPLMKGKRHCPAQCGRKPGSISEPATGFICAHLTPKGTPSEASDGLPLLAKVPAAPTRPQHALTPPLHAVAGELGLHDPVLRQDLHERGLLTVGMAKTIEPMQPNPSAQEIRDRLNEAGLHRQRTPCQVHVACARGDHRPVVASHIARLLARGAGQGRDKGLEGASIPQGMTGMGHTGAVLVRIRQQPRTKRAQKCRRLLGLTSPKINKINHQKTNDH
jgi:DNA-binding transcriptional regulator YdaS (Cro superfamily)